MRGGWFDYNLPGTWGGYHALAAAPHQALVIGPWTHLAWAPRQAGHDFGAAALGDMDALQVAWFDWALKGRGGPPVLGVRVFDIGANQWRVFPRWPETRPHVLHLTGDGRVAVRGGGLSGQPGAASREVFVHDPYRPVPATPYLGERSEIDQRTDVLVFCGAPLAAPLTILGEVRVDLAITADAPSFDVSAVLSRVTPDGRAHVLTSGYRHVPAGGAVSVSLKPSCITLMPGERLRLSVAAAAFPAYPVNPGTGTDPRAATAMEAVPITCDLATNGSALILPRLAV